jgi:hypothetical protein
MHRSGRGHAFLDAFKANGGVDLILAAHDKYYERSTITGGIVRVITNIGNSSPRTRFA